jgi:hypothetical protein
MARTAAGYLPEGMPLAYLIATVIFGVGLSIAALVHVSQPGRIVIHASPEASNRKSPIPNPSPKTPIVARITGMVDCVWEGSGFGGQGSGAAGQKSEIINHRSPIRLGDRLSLKSGLLELSYDTGARVILQGHVSYEVESPVGGCLSLGKLTAKLEQKSEVRGQRSESADQKSQITDHQFVIRTPIALVTDLGTEFGVEVDAGGRTRSHVFRGAVRVQRLSADGTPETTGVVLHKNESIQVAKDANGETVSSRTTAPSRFVRSLPRQAIKALDLVDVVAGGDGFSGNRNRGIDPTTGRMCRTRSSSLHLMGDHQYHRVEGIPFVDGVFIPDGRLGPVQVDSAGHTCDWFLETCNEGYGPIWAGMPVPWAGPSELGGVDYAASGHGALFLHANKGVTFDLEAIRRANAGWRPLRFLATAGNTETASREGRNNSICTDFSVIVDGQSRFARSQINGLSGAFKVVVAIQEKDRFLTLAAADGDRELNCDQIMFGDPRIELIEIVSRDAKSRELE